MPKRDQQVIFLTTEAEKEALKAEAAERGMSVGEVVRERVNGYPGAMRDADDWRTMALSRAEAEGQLESMRDSLMKSEGNLCNASGLLERVLVHSPEVGWEWDMRAYRGLCAELGVDHPYFRCYPQEGL